MGVLGQVPRPRRRLRSGSEDQKVQTRALRWPLAWCATEMTLSPSLTLFSSDPKYEGVGWKMSGVFSG